MKSRKDQFEHVLSTLNNTIGRALGAWFIIGVFVTLALMLLLSFNQ